MIKEVIIKYDIPNEGWSYDIDEAICALKANKYIAAISNIKELLSEKLSNEERLTKEQYEMVEELQKLILEEIEDLPITS